MSKDLNIKIIFYVSMRGVYVLDLESDQYFIISGNGMIDVSVEMKFQLKQMNLSASYDGSYHFYPIHANETEYEAEKRIYWMMVKKYGIQSVFARKELLQSIGKGTWTTDMEIKKLVRVDSNPSIQDSSADKEMFQISI